MIPEEFAEPSESTTLLIFKVSKRLVDCPIEACIVCVVLPERESVPLSVLPASPACMSLAFITPSPAILPEIFKLFPLLMIIALVASVIVKSVKEVVLLLIFRLLLLPMEAPPEFSLLPLIAEIVVLPIFILPELLKVELPLKVALTKFKFPAPLISEPLPTLVSVFT